MVSAASPLEAGLLLAGLLTALHRLADARAAYLQLSQSLQKPLELAPDFTDGRLQYGLALLEDKQWAASLEQLRQVKSVNPDNAGWFFNARAYDNVQLGNDAEARKDLETARKWVKSVQDITQNQTLQKVIDSRRKPH